MWNGRCQAMCETFLIYSSLYNRNLTTEPALTYLGSWLLRMHRLQCILYYYYIYWIQGLFCLRTVAARSHNILLILIYVYIFKRDRLWFCVTKMHSNSFGVFWNLPEVKLKKKKNTWGHCSMSDREIGIGIHSMGDVHILLLLFRIRIIWAFGWLCSFTEE